jgi:putative ABC transport system permease protein
VILSIGIGIAMYIGVQVVGYDIEDRVTQDVSLIGNVTIISVEHAEYRHRGAPLQYFVPKVAERIRELPEVHSASMNMRSPHTVPMRVGDRIVHIRMMGVDAAFWDVYALRAIEGRLFSDEDIKQRSRVCVLGTKAARELFGEGPYVGRTITLYKDNYTVIGVVAGFMLQGKEDRCFLPLSTAEDRSFADNNYPNRILVRLKHLTDVDAMYEKLPGLILEQQKAPYLWLEYSGESIRSVRLIVGRVHVILQLGIVAALGLGCFGIWQSSFTSVRERTREIGLKLAMGAEQKDIMLQFLGEALCSALLGGVTGIVVGTAAVLGLCAWLTIAVPWWELCVSVPVSLFVATLVGALGGTYPSLQAGRMDVATALRFE